MAARASTGDVKNYPAHIPRQTQARQPGIEAEMHPRPEFAFDEGSGKLEGKKALITGGDSGIGRAVAVLYAREGADVSIVYKPEEEKDAEKTRRFIEQNEGRRCLKIPGDICDRDFCRTLVERTVQELGGLDILVNNAAVQFPEDRLEDITYENLMLTFNTNIIAMFLITQAALPHMAEGACIINTTSVTAYKGNKHLLDYSSTKGAIVTFTRSLARNLVDRKIRVNAVAPGPIWTPLIPASFDEKKVEDFGKQSEMKRAGQPEEVAPCFVFLASRDSTYMSGQTLHPNGGVVVNG